MLADRLFRIRYSKTGEWTESGLNRYGVLAADFPEAAFEKAEANGVHTLATKQAKLAIRASDGAITLADAAGKPLTEQAAPQYQAGGGYDVRFALSNDERLYGMGDVSRENVMRRGGAYEFWVLNVKAYIPIPVVFSSRGWGLLMNTTWRNTIDVGKSDPERMICTARPQRSRLLPVLRPGLPQPAGRVHLVQRPARSCRSGVAPSPTSATRTSTRSTC